MKKYKWLLLIILLVTAGCSKENGKVSDSSANLSAGAETEAPDPIGKTTGTGIILAKTGQDVCYDVEGAVISCDLTSQDGDIQAGIAWPVPRFVAGSDDKMDCVTDGLTGLMWLRSPSSTVMTWKEALSYAEGLSLCGYDDWHLPNRLQLKSIINYGKDDMVGWLHENGFSDIKPESNYWTSTTYPSDEYTYDGWFMEIYDGYIFSQRKTNSSYPSDFYAWPVRMTGIDAKVKLPETGQSTCYDEEGAVVSCDQTGQDGELHAGIAWPDPRFTLLTGTHTGCIVDNLTGLVWVREANTTQMDWADALKYTEELSVCGYTDWRLPNINELDSLVNAEVSDTAAWLNTQGFKDIVPNSTWTSTTHAIETDAAWVIHMFDGYLHPDGKKFPDYYVLPVHRE